MDSKNFNIDPKTLEAMKAKAQIIAEELKHFQRQAASTQRYLAALNKAIQTVEEEIKKGAVKPAPEMSVVMHDLSNPGNPFTPRDFMEARNRENVAGDYSVEENN